MSELPPARGRRLSGRLTDPMRELLWRIPDEWGPLPRYFDAGVYQALKRRALVEASAYGYRTTAAGKAALAPEPVAALERLVEALDDLDLGYTDRAALLTRRLVEARASIAAAKARRP